MLARMATICKTGGRNYQSALTTFASLVWGVGRAAEPDTDDARKANEMYERLRDLDQRGVLQVACSFIQGYLEKHPAERTAVMTMIGIREAK